MNRRTRILFGLAALRSLASAHPRITKLIPIGKSQGGTEIAVLRIAGQTKGGTDPDLRTAAFVAANIEGLHLIGTEAALALGKRLLSGYGTGKAITELLDSRTLYVAPLLNPDAAETFFGSPRLERTTNARPVDEDLDMQVDEDGPDDLNKDGLITQIRVKDPEGKWLPDPQ